MQVELVFDPKDFVVGKEMFADNTMAGLSTIPEDRYELNEGVPIASIALDVAKIALPGFIALIALWLGKGKSVTVRTKGKSLQLKNVSEKKAEALVEKFLKE